MNVDTMRKAFRRSRHYSSPIVKCLKLGADCCVSRRRTPLAPAAPVPVPAERPVLHPALNPSSPQDPGCELSQSHAAALAAGANEMDRWTPPAAMRLTLSVNSPSKLPVQIITKQPQDS